MQSKELKFKKECVIDVANIDAANNERAKKHLEIMKLILVPKGTNQKIEKINEEIREIDADIERIKKNAGIEQSEIKDCLDGKSPEMKKASEIARIAQLMNEISDLRSQIKVINSITDEQKNNFSFQVIEYIQKYVTQSPVNYDILQLHQDAFIADAQKLLEFYKNQLSEILKSKNINKSDLDNENITNLIDIIALYQFYSENHRYIVQGAHNKITYESMKCNIINIIKNKEVEEQKEKSLEKEIDAEKEVKEKGEELLIEAKEQTISEDLNQTNDLHASHLPEDSNDLDQEKKAIELQIEKIKGQIERLLNYDEKSVAEKSYISALDNTSSIQEDFCLDEAKAETIKLLSVGLYKLQQELENINKLKSEPKIGASFLAPEKNSNKQSQEYNFFDESGSDINARVKSRILDDGEKLKLDNSSLLFQDTPIPFTMDEDISQANDNEPLRQLLVTPQKNPKVTMAGYMNNISSMVEFTNQSQIASSNLDKNIANISNILGELNPPFTPHNSVIEQPQTPPLAQPTIPPLKRDASNDSKSSSNKSNKDSKPSSASETGPKSLLAAILNVIFSNNAQSLDKLSSFLKLSVELPTTYAFDASEYTTMLNVIKLECEKFDTSYQEQHGKKLKIDGLKKKDDFFKEPMSIFEFIKTKVYVSNIDTAELKQVKAEVKNIKDIFDNNLNKFSIIPLYNEKDFTWLDGKYSFNSSTFRLISFNKNNLEEIKKQQKQKLEFMQAKKEDTRQKAINKEKEAKQKEANDDDDDLISTKTIYIKGNEKNSKLKSTNPDLAKPEAKPASVQSKPAGATSAASVKPKIKPEPAQSKLTTEATPVRLTAFSGAKEKSIPTSVKPTEKIKAPESTPTTVPAPAQTTQNNEGEEKAKKQVEKNRAIEEFAKKKSMSTVFKKLKQNIEEAQYQRAQEKENKQKQILNELVKKLDQVIYDMEYYNKGHGDISGNFVVFVKGIVTLVKFANTYNIDLSNQEIIEKLLSHLMEYEEKYQEYSTLITDLGFATINLFEVVMIILCDKNEDKLNYAKIDQVNQAISNLLPQCKSDEVLKCLSVTNELEKVSEDAKYLIEKKKTDLISAKSSKKFQAQGEFSTGKVELLKPAEKKSKIKEDDDDYFYNAALQKAIQASLETKEKMDEEPGMDANENGRFNGDFSRFDKTIDIQEELKIKAGLLKYYTNSGLSQEEAEIALCETLGNMDY